jgi:four helix bundle protein
MAVKATHFKELQVWQKGMLLAQGVYRLTSSFPSDERYGLSSQMRRAAVSIPSNIAEGQARHATKEFLLFLSHAAGSLAELETQLILAERLGFCKIGNAKELQALVHEIQKMLSGLRSRLAARV